MKPYHQTDAGKYFGSFRYALTREVGTAQWKVGAVYWGGRWPHDLPMLIRNLWMAWRECRRMNKDEIAHH
jgi:hypothetical protein